MAIYRDGTASLSADGKATGTGTQWTKPLSLIRVGATVIFLSGSKPVLGTISEILSDTQMNLTSTNGETAADGQYAILVHDSLTVEGLAQDISEALRYYQGAEAELGQLNQQIQSYVKSAQDSATAAKTSETNAGTKATAAANSATAAANSATAAKTSETNAGNSASSAAGSATTASQRATAAAGSATTAGDRATAAANSAAAAKTSETNAAATLSSAVKKDGDTMNGNLIVNDAATGNNTQISKGAIEIYGETPFIDFHYQRAAADYSVRIINTEASALEVAALSGAISFRINGGIRIGGANFPGGANVYRGNGDSNAVWGYNVSDGNFNFVRGSAAGASFNIGDSVMRGMRAIAGKRGLNGEYNLNTHSFFWNGGMEMWVDSSNVGTIQLASTSDRELKKDIEYLSDLSADYKEKALNQVLKWNPATFKYKARGVMAESREMLGYIANDVIEQSPECVTGKGLKPGWDEENPDDPYVLDTVAMSAKQTLAIQALYDIIGKLTARIEELESKK